MTGGDGDSIRAVSDVDGIPMYMAEFQHNGSDYRIDNFHAFPYDTIHVKPEEEFSPLVAFQRKIHMEAVDFPHLISYP